MTDSESPGAVPDKPRRGLVRRFFGGLWWMVDGSRKLVLNLLFLLIVGVLLFGWLRSGPPPLQDKTVLVMRLGGPLVEQRSGSARDRAMKQVRGEPDAQVQLRDVLRVLDAAATDPKISSVLLVLDDYAGGGLPNQREFVAALQRFKQASGKKVVAWGAGYDQRQYFVAAHADEVLMHPMGAVYLQGFGSLRNYYREAFDRLGVSANVIRAGKYKNFGEPYFASAPSKETLEADASLYDALWAVYTDAVETARKLPAGSIARGIETVSDQLQAAGGDTAKLALQTKLVDGLKTQDEMREIMIQRGARDSANKSTFRQIHYGDYLSRLPVSPIGGDAVGVIVAEGSISDGEAPPGAIGGRSTADLVRQAREDDKVKAIVLRVRSPGGSVFGSELVRRELELTRAAGKPIVVSMGDVAASGGYWISMASDEVIADVATVTGSIGVFAMLPTADGLVAKLSVHTGGYGTTWLANAYDPRKPMDPRFAGLVQAGVSHIYSDFTRRVAQARKSTPEKIDEVAQGRVWTGQQAKERGLVDRVGSFSDALESAATRAKLAKGYRTVYIERDQGRLSRLISLFNTSAAGAVDGAIAQWTQQLAGPAALVPEPLRQMQAEMAWLAELSSQHQPFSAVIHCLCTPP
ncbi:signal peptide peptidase SppA [Aquabacterium sp.]|uniref:signal peptide peptidase SppA n=1 Tax=Aquabacterium sp. TaxID=1872578 RepID=UPI002CE71D57|nr:signal peptide peptidase SppA [Aquabacterium sp.]HSW03297.1 signal peptide peptidase SppA [Aquabacterium sp.]